MPLPADFHFSQGSLQDYVDCQRRFQLRYLLQVAWPALEAEPALENERHMQQGARFHRLVHQHLLGVPAQHLTPTAEQDEDLARWWQSYLRHSPVPATGTRYPEITLSAPLAGYRLTATYDLVVVATEGRSLIFDWKTSRRRSPRQWLAGRLQTRVYPYLLVRAGADLNGGQPIEPEQVEMVYWFAEFPTRPERFVYNREQFAEDNGYLTGLIEEIKTLSLSDEPLPLTPIEERCRFCVYRSLCDRGITAGPLDEIMDLAEFLSEEALDVELDFEQIAEIEY